MTRTQMAYNAAIAAEKRNLNAAWQADRQGRLKLAESHRRAAHAFRRQANARLEEIRADESVNA